MLVDVSIWYIPLMCLGATCSWRSTVSNYLFAIKSNLEKVVKGCRHSLAFHAIFVKRCEFAAGAYIWWSAAFVTHICCPQMLSIIEMQFHRNTFAIFKKFQSYLNDIVDFKKIIYRYRVLNYEYIWQVFHNSKERLLKMRSGDERKGREDFCSFRFKRKYFTSSENTSSQPTLILEGQAFLILQKF